MYVFLMNEWDMNEEKKSRIVQYLYNDSKSHNKHVKRMNEKMKTRICVKISLLSFIYIGAKYVFTFYSLKNKLEQ